MVVLGIEGGDGLWVILIYWIVIGKVDVFVFVVVVVKVYLLFIGVEYGGVFFVNGVEGIV